MPSLSGNRPRRAALVLRAVVLPTLGLLVGALPAPATEIYVTDGQNDCVYKFSGSGSLLHTYSLPVATSPLGVALDGSGNLYVLGNASGSIYKISSAGAVSTFASGFTNPSGLAFDGSGNLYVGDSSTSVITKLDPQGKNPTSFVDLSNINADAQAVSGLAFDKNGNLYAADPADPSGRVYKIASNGSSGVVYAEGLATPEGLALDASGNLYVAGYGDGSVTKIAAVGATKSAYVSGLSDAPVGLGLDDSQNLFISDRSPTACLLEVPQSQSPTPLVNGSYGTAGFVAVSLPEPASLVPVAGGLFVLLKRRRPAQA